MRIAAAAALQARMLRRPLAAVGAAVISGVRLPCFVAALGVAVLRTAADPLSWRQPVRAELRRPFATAAGHTLHPVLGRAVLVGIGTVFQTLYRLSAAGQDILVNEVIAGMLICEVAPLVVELLSSGRNGTTTLMKSPRSVAARACAFSRQEASIRSCF